MTKFVIIVNKSSPLSFSKKIISKIFLKIKNGVQGLVTPPQITLLQIGAVGGNLRKGVFALSIAEGLTYFLPCAILEMATPYLSAAALAIER